MRQKDLGNYILYSDGSIFSKRRNKFMSLCPNNNGYLTTVIGNKSVRIHRLIGIHFVDNPHNFKELNHIDGDKSNNSESNLEWCTRGSNISHSFSLGLNRGNGKLSDWQVKAIRWLTKYYRKTNSELSYTFGVDKSCISNINTFKSFRHVK